MKKTIFSIMLASAATLAQANQINLDCNYQTPNGKTTAVKVSLDTAKNTAFAEGQSVQLFSSPTHYWFTAGLASGSVDLRTKYQIDRRDLGLSAELQLNKRVFTGQCAIAAAEKTKI